MGHLRPFEYYYLHESEREGERIYMWRWNWSRKDVIFLLSHSDLWYRFTFEVRTSRAHPVDRKM